MSEEPRVRLKYYEEENGDLVPVVIGAGEADSLKGWITTESAAESELEDEDIASYVLSKILTETEDGVYVFDYEGAEIKFSENVTFEKEVHFDEKVEFEKKVVFKSEENEVLDKIADVEDPGPEMYVGTDSGGDIGWYPLPDSQGMLYAIVFG